MKWLSEKSRLKLVVIPIILSFMLVIPAMQIGAGAEGGEKPAGEENFENSTMDASIAPYLGTLDLSQGTMEQYIGGEGEDDNLGYSFDKADINNDGNEDIILGAPEYNDTRGGVFIFLGGNKDRIIDSSEADIIIDNDEFETFFGLKVKSGDVNNDGFADIVVAGYQNNDYGPKDDRNDYSKAFLFLGMESWPSRLSTSQADTVYIGSSTTGNFGWDVEVGDITGDGYDDVIISEMEYWKTAGAGGGASGKLNDFFSQPGPEGKDAQAYIGNPTMNQGSYSYLMTNYGVATRGFCEWDLSEIKGPIEVEEATIGFYHQYNTNSGYIELREVLEPWGEMTLTWANQPEVNDERAAFQQLNPQNTMMNFNSESENNEGILEMIENWVNIENNGVRLSGENGNYNNAYFASSDSSSPRPKLEFTWRKAGGSGMNGTIFMFDGGPVMEPVRNASLGASPLGYDHIITNKMNSTGLAQSDLDLGDINGDGFEDILIGSVGMQMEGKGAGGAQVIFGGRNMLTDIDLHSYPHINITSLPGYQLSYVTHADINGDGIDDIVTCAPFAFGDLSGGAFVFYGDLLLESGKLSIIDSDFMIRGPRPEWNFNVQNAGDLNRDGRDDLWIFSNMGEGEDMPPVSYLLYMNYTDGLPDPSKYYMEFELPSFKILGANEDSAIGYYERPSIMTLDFNGDGIDELLMVDPWDSFGSRPDGSGVIYFHYSVRSEVRIDDFSVLDLHGENMDIVCAGSVYHAYAHVTNTWDINDFNSINLQFAFHGKEVEGLGVFYSWNRGLMEMVESSDPNDWAEIESSIVIPDGEHGYHIYFNFSLNSNIPSEDPVDMSLDVTGGIDLSAALTFPGLFYVEPDVEFVGDLVVEGGINGVLSPGSFVQPGERIEISGLRVVYQGTDVSPPNNYFGVRLMDNFGNVFLNVTSSGLDILFTYRTQDLAGREDFNLTLIDLVGEADDMAGLITFFYVVDTDLPDPPLDLEIKADSDIDTLIGFDNDPEVFVSWSQSSDLTSEVMGYMYNVYDGGGTGDGWFTPNTHIVYDGLVEGWNTIYVWSVDSAMNYGPSTSSSVFYDVDDPTFGEPNPSPGSWVNSNTVNYEMPIFDLDGSGVKGRTVEYSISYDGGVTYSSWEPTNLRRDGEQITVKLFLNFREGEDNFVKWRSRDVSGNGYVESDSFQVKVDSVPLTYKSATPSDPVDSSYAVCGITLTDGKGSGIDGRSVQYSISHNGVSNYGPWETLDLSGSYSDIEVSTPPIYFERDTLNYIKWRAMDIAGNGYIYSLDIPIEVMPDKINHEPVPIISSPIEFTKYLGSSAITFDGTGSIDADGDDLNFLWYSDHDGYLGTEALFKGKLSEDNHLITLHVDDGIANVSITVSITVVPDITNVDTDRDGIVDLVDTDDDDDGLLDIDEDKNMNGLLDGNETDPKNSDTDGDGVNDRLDHAPRNPLVTRPEIEDTLPSWLFVLLLILILAALLVFGAVWYLKQRTDKERMDARRNLRRTRRNLKRFEVLTGVPTNDLPAIEAIQWALPGVIHEASGFVMETPPSDDLLPPVDDDGSVSDDISKPDLDDMEVPAPVSDGSSISSDVSGPEPPSMDGPVVGGDGGNVLNCALCGSEIVAPVGGSQVECPLCGELNEL